MERVKFEVEFYEDRTAVQRWFGLIDGEWQSLPDAPEVNMDQQEARFLLTMMGITVQAGIVQSREG